jgi:hypothetical protein
MPRQKCLLTGFECHSAKKDSGIAFETDRDGDFELFVMNAERSGGYEVNPESDW